MPYFAFKAFNNNFVKLKQPVIPEAEDFWLSA